MADNRESWGVVRSTDRDPAQLVIRSRSRLCNREDSPIRICVLRCWVFDAEGFMIAVTSDQRIIPPPNGPADRNLEVCKRIKDANSDVVVAMGFDVVQDFGCPFNMRPLSAEVDIFEVKWIVFAVDSGKSPS
jgi:hypothetical protein